MLKRLAQRHGSLLGWRHARRRTAAASTGRRQQLQAHVGLTPSSHAAPASGGACKQGMQTGAASSQLVQHMLGPARDILYANEGMLGECGAAYHSKAQHGAAQPASSRQPKKRGRRRSTALHSTAQQGAAQQAVANHCSPRQAKNEGECVLRIHSSTAQHSAALPTVPGQR